MDWQNRFCNSAGSAAPHGVEEVATRTRCRRSVRGGQADFVVMPVSRAAWSRRSGCPDAVPQAGAGRASRLRGEAGSAATHRVEEVPVCLGTFDFVQQELHCFQIIHWIQ